LTKLNTHRLKLERDGLSLAGKRLQAQTASTALGALIDEPFLEYLLATKPPLMIAESAVYGDGRDWVRGELSLLGDVGVALPVVAFDDGKQLDPAIHPTPCRRPVKNATSPQLGHIDAVGPREPTFLATASSPFK